MPPGDFPYFRGSLWGGRSFDYAQDDCAQDDCAPDDSAPRAAGKTRHCQFR